MMRQELLTSPIRGVTLRARRRLCRADGAEEFRVQQVVTSWGAFGQPIVGTTRISMAVLHASREPCACFSVAWPLRFGAKGAVPKKGSDAGGVARRMCEGFFDVDADPRWADARRERCTCARGY